MTGSMAGGVGVAPGTVAGAVIGGAAYTAGKMVEWFRQQQQPLGQYRHH
ncbi:hypothetical protein [Serratia proteamaculans]|uniref:Uncharacterized protein n=1 Tax=Serratia proteamaculans TaxID=28151 RepID=A0ABS0TWA3_SERPR|nr:hypothetical protein [Serratia proteamaculans]MBI6182649.1 hypothetical protein [Serratia proteamaculans]